MNRILKRNAMTSQRKAELGEGKIGCIVSLLLLIIASALVIKIVPVYYSNSSLVTVAEDLGSRAALLPKAAIEAQLRAKAAELEIPEAVAKGAMTVAVVGDSSSGTCNITLKFTRKVDLFGIYTLPVEMDKTVSRPYMDAR